MNCSDAPEDHPNGVDQLGSLAVHKIKVEIEDTDNIDQIESKTIQKYEGDPDDALQSTIHDSINVIEPKVEVFTDSDDGENESSVHSSILPFDMAENNHTGLEFPEYSTDQVELPDYEERDFNVKKIKLEKIKQENQTDVCAGNGVTSNLTRDILEIGSRFPKQLETIGDEQRAKILQLQSFDFDLSSVPCSVGCQRPCRHKPSIQRLTTSLQLQKIKYKYQEIEMRRIEHKARVEKYRLEKELIKARIEFSALENSLRKRNLELSLAQK